MNCNECQYAIWESEEFEGSKYYSVEGCKLGCRDKEECEEEYGEEI